MTLTFSLYPTCTRSKEGPSGLTALHLADTAQNPFLRVRRELTQLTRPFSPYGKLTKIQQAPGFLEVQTLHA